MSVDTPCALTSWVGIPTSAAPTIGPEDSEIFGPTTSQISYMYTVL